MLAADFKNKKIKFLASHQQQIIFHTLRSHQTQYPRPTST